MAREAAGRIQIRAKLVAETPWHVGGVGADVATDLPLARDGEGRVYLPGTSLAGAFRHWLERAFEDQEKVTHVCGYQKDNQGHASHWTIEDVTLPELVQDQVEVRSSVGINRVLGAAHPGILYDRAIVPRGSTIDLDMTVEYPTKERGNEAGALFAHLLSALMEGEIRLGASKSRGLGRVRLEGTPTLIQQALDTHKGIIQVLRSPREGGVLLHDLEALKKHLKMAPRPRLMMTLEWVPTSPVMVKASYDGLVADMMPLTSRRGTEIVPVIPGSSIKGALRFRAEQIVRTVLQTEAIVGFRKRDDFLTMIELPLVTALFGQANEPQDNVGQEEDNEMTPCPMPGLSALFVDDVYARKGFAQNDWTKIQTAATSPEMISSLKDHDAKDWSPAYHVAIDRWTGGAADSALFAVLEPWNLGWEPIRLALDLTRLKTDDQFPALTLLLLVLRDLSSWNENHGDVEFHGPSLPIGFAINRGFGDFRIITSLVVGHDLESHTELKLLDGCLLLNGSELAQIKLPGSLLEVLQREWTNWIEREHKKITLVTP